MHAAYDTAAQAGTPGAILTARMMAWQCAANLRHAKRALEAGHWGAAHESAGEGQLRCRVRVIMEV